MLASATRLLLAALVGAALLAAPASAVAIAPVASIYGYDAPVAATTPLASTRLDAQRAGPGSWTAPRSPTPQLGRFRAATGEKGLRRLETSESWGRADTLADHFARHGADLGTRTADEYASMASRFLQRAQRDGLPTKIDSRGTIRVYDPKSNTFGSYNASATTKTFYKPDQASHGYPSNADYWNAQPGSAP